MPAAPSTHRMRIKASQKHRSGQTARGTARERGYTRQWERFRDQFRRAHPLCGYCLNRTSRVVPGVVVDHIIPHRGDPDRFWPVGPPTDHFMHCCVECHALKQKVEWIADRFGHNLRHLMVRRGMLNERTDDPLDFPAGERLALPEGSVLVYGPPASGKTTAAQDMGGIVYDLDEYAVGLGLPRYGRTMDEARAAAVARNEALRAHQGPQPAIIIATCANPWEVHRWVAATGCAVRLVAGDADTCHQRVWADPARLSALPSQMAAINRWFRLHPPAQ